MLLQLGPFGGELPKLAPEHLPAGRVIGALRALDCRIYSGDLIPVRENQTGPAAGVDLPRVILGLYEETGTDVSDIRWLCWESDDVDAVVAPSEAEGANKRRVYWTTGDVDEGPRWTTYDDAGAAPGEPNASYPLVFPPPDPGMPAPAAVSMPQPGQPTQGDTRARSYAYTLVNSLGWESAPSLPSASLNSRDGVRVQVTVPAFPNAPANRWTHIRLYRLVTGDETSTYHQIPGDIMIGATDTVYNDDTPDSGLAGAGLPTLTYTPLPGDAKGLVLAHNGIYAAFKRDVLYLSAPGRPWAWPIANRYDIPAPIIAVAATNNNIVVLTEEYPYLLTGSDPSDMEVSRIDTPHPCKSKRSVVALGNAVIYAANAGLALIQDVTASVPTAQIHDWDTWQITRPDTLRAVWYKGRYLAVGQEASFVFGADGELTSITLAATALWADLREGRTFAALPKGDEDASAPIAWYDADGQSPKTFQWISKVFVLPRPMLFSTIAVVAEFEDAVELASERWARAMAQNRRIMDAYQPLGTHAGPQRSREADMDPTGPSSPAGENAALARTLVASSPWTDRIGVLGADETGAVRILLYSAAPDGTWTPLADAPDTDQLTECWVSDRKAQRFKPPYRTDELVVVIESSTRVRRVYVCEIPAELAGA